MRRLRRNRQLNKSHRHPRPVSALCLIDGKCREARFRTSRAPLSSVTIKRPPGGGKGRKEVWGGRGATRPVSSSRARGAQQREQSKHASGWDCLPPWLTCPCLSLTCERLRLWSWLGLATKRPRRRRLRCFDGGTTMAARTRGDEWNWRWWRPLAGGSGKCREVGDPGTKHWRFRDWSVFRLVWRNLIRIR